MRRIMARHKHANQCIKTYAVMRERFLKSVHLHARIPTACISLVQIGIAHGGPLACVIELNLVRDQCQLYDKFSDSNEGGIITDQPQSTDRSLQRFERISKRRKFQPPLVRQHETTPPLL
jgi:hypothetical protein